MARVFILILLIIVLPLRGWTAERMAEHMAASNSGAAPQHAMGAMPADCPMMMVAAQQMDAADGGDGSDSAPQHPAKHTTCQACQLCMSLATQDTPVLQTTGPAPQAVAVHPADRFASADLPRSIKPPIS